MTLLNSILQTLVNGLLAPFRQFPIGALVLISIVTAVGMLLVFKKTSNQTALEAVKRRIHACLFEIRLFNDDLRAIFRAQFEILRTNLSYLRLQLVPLVFILPPMILLLTQLQPHYGYRGLHIGESVLVKVAVDDSLTGEGAAKPPVHLEVPAGLRLETPGVWIPARGELAWRMVAEQAGKYDLIVHLADESFAKSVQVSEEFVSRSPLRAVPGFVDQLLFPAEKPLPKGASVRAIELAYPEDPTFFFMPRWMWIFFVLTIVFAFALRKPMKVTI
ncbi:MAG: hypothetical protein WBO54_08905 [Thermoanaerobaculia bacterium]